jgi:hypothetical protein
LEDFHDLALSVQFIKVGQIAMSSKRILHKALQSAASTRQNQTKNKEIGAEKNFTKIQEEARWQQVAPKS